MTIRPFAAALSLGLLTLSPAWSPGQVTTTTTTTTTTVHTGPHIIVPQVSIHPRRRPHAPPTPVELTAVSANISVDEQVAATTLELTLTNRAHAQQEAVVLLPVPDGVSVRSLLYDGVGPEPTARVLPRDEARSIYDAIVRSMRDPALVEFAGYNLIRTSAFPIPPGKSQKLSLTYEQVLPMDGDRVDYALPRSEALSGGGAWTIHADIRSRRPITGVYSPSHEIETKRESERRVRIELTGRPAEQPGAVRFSYLLGRTDDPLSVSTMAYPDPSLSDGKGGFFMMLAALPPGSQESKVKREVILVLDRSGSMKGDKMKQALAAAAQIIEGLEEGEAFNIIDYSDSIQSFADAPVIKSRETAAQARSYLGRIQASGGTNIHDALLEALRGRPTEGMLPMVLFLTDGLPTVGERSEVAIREAVKKANDDDRRIFSFGVGFDVNTPLLSNVSKASRGAATFVLPDEDVEVKVSQVFRRLAGPILASPRLTVRDADGGRDTRALRELLPAELPDIFDGDQIVLTGQYTSDQPVTLRLSGEYLGEPRHFDFELDVSKASTRHSYVPRIWANRKVADLIDHIRQAAADTANPLSDAARKEIVEEIIALSTKYGILTEYTAFLATEPETRFDSPARRAENLRAADEAIRERAGGVRSGAGGVAQEMNVQRQAAATAPAQTGGRLMYYKDDGDQINEVAITTVQNIADRTFFQRKNRWVESQLLATEGQKPDRTVEFGSDEYMALARELARDNRQVALALGGDVLLQVGSERILVKGP